jgi:diguanylate cyclase (GGDEF)-like protein
MPPVRRAPLVWRAVAVATVVGVPMVWVVLVDPRTTAGRLAQLALAVGVTGVICAYVVRILSRRTRAVADLRHQRTTDPLTALPNRARLVDTVAARQRAAGGVLLVVDLDRFTAVNDSLGQRAGDEMLVRIAERIAGLLPSRSTLARLTSDEYAIVADGTEDDGVLLAGRLLDALRRPLQLVDGDVVATASAGVVALDPETQPDELLRRADAAMRQAKQVGGNTVARFNSRLHERAPARLQLETALHRAVEREELSLFHQPIVEMGAGQVVGFEALLRWHRADGTDIAPAEFVPIAEDNGSIVAIGAWVLHRALVQLRAWIDDGTCRSGVTMSVNVSARQLADAGFPSTVGTALAASDLPGSALWLEITETAMITQPDQALAGIRRVRDLGVRVSVDDFGTGFSSLSLLQRFPLQQVKIDRDFVAGVASTPSDTAIVRTIVAMARSLNLDLVAEGVETVAQLQVLADLGCAKAQGYLLCHPLPPADIPAAIAGLERLGRYPGLRPDVTV